MTSLTAFVKFYDRDHFERMRYRAEKASALAEVPGIGDGHCFSGQQHGPELAS